MFSFCLFLILVFRLVLFIFFSDSYSSLVISFLFLLVNMPPNLITICLISLILALISVSSSVALILPVT